LNDIECLFLVLYRKQRLLEGPAFNVGKKSREFGASGQNELQSVSPVACWARMAKPLGYRDFV
jgi:hypothetical protein